MGLLWKDIRYALRALRKSTGFAIAAVIVLALGIGANTAIFSVVNSVLIRPLPFPDSDRVMTVLHTPPKETFPGVTNFSVSPANFLDWNKDNHVFEGMSAYSVRDIRLTGTNRAEVVTTGRVGSDFFSLLRSQPAIGRAFLPEEDQPGHSNVVILSYAFWRDRFGARSDIIGETLSLDGQSYNIVGVMPLAFTLQSWNVAAAQAWIPLAWTPEERAVRGNHNYSAMARLKPGVSVAQAQAELDTISRRLEKQYPAEDKGWGAVVTPLHESLVGNVRPTLLVLLGAVAFVLLIACANVANLVLSRTLGRRKEIAIRTALGASRVRVLRQMLTETVILSLAGGAIGLFLAQFGVSFIIAFLGRQLPRSTDIAVDVWVLAFTLGISLVTGIIAGLTPGIQFAKAELNDALKQGLGKTDSDSSGGRTRSALVVAEVALSLVLLVGAGLMIRSLWNLESVDPGFQASHVQTMFIGLPRAQFAQPVQWAAFFDQTLQKVRVLPGVMEAGAIDGLPMRGGSTQTVAIERRPVAKADEPAVAVRATTPGYFRTMRIHLERGREITEGDAAERQPVAVISASMVRHFWPNEDPLGKRITLLFEPDIKRTIVGVVGDVKLRGVDVATPMDTVYTPFAQSPSPGMALVVRTIAPPENLVSAITGAVHEIDREQSVRFVNTMEDIVANSLSGRRFSMFLLSAFAVLAVLLAAVGIYSVLSYSVKRRMREVGIRMALGAKPGDVIRLVVIEGMKPTLLGVAVGLAGALVLGRVVQSLIFGVSSYDPLTLTAVAALLIGAALLACLVPAYRATRVDAIQTLREE